MQAPYFQLIDIEHDGTSADTVGDLHQAVVPVQQTLPHKPSEETLPFSSLV